MKSVSWNEQNSRRSINWRFIGSDRVWVYWLVDWVPSPVCTLRSRWWWNDSRQINWCNWRQCHRRRNAVDSSMSPCLCCNYWQSVNQHRHQTSVQLYTKMNNWKFEKFSSVKREYAASLTPDDSKWHKVFWWYRIWWMAHCPCTMRTGTIVPNECSHLCDLFWPKRRHWIRR